MKMIIEFIRDFFKEFFKEFFNHIKTGNNVLWLEIPFLIILSPFILIVVIPILTSFAIFLRADLMFFDKTKVISANNRIVTTICRIYIIFSFLLVLYFFYLKDNNLDIVIYLSIPLFFIYIITVLFHKIPSGRKTGTRIAIRIVLLFLFGFAVLYYLVFGLIAYRSYTYVLEIPDNIFSVLIDILMTFSYMQCILVASIYIMGLGGTIIRNNSQLLFSKFGYVLYLRSFIIDNMDEDIINQIKKYTEPKGDTILRIGDPNKLFYFADDIHTFFLPTKNWKAVLRKKIRRSKCVFLVIDKTPGLLWEIVENRESHKKYIFYLRFSMCELSLKYLEEQPYTFPEIETLKTCISILTNVMSEKNYDALAFYYDNINCVHSENVELIIDYHQNGSNYSRCESPQFIQIIHQIVKTPTLRLSSNREVEVRFVDESEKVLNMYAGETKTINISKPGPYEFHVIDKRTRRKYFYSIFICLECENTLNIETQNILMQLSIDIMCFVVYKQKSFQRLCYILWALLYLYIFIKYLFRLSFSGNIEGTVLFSVLILSGVHFSGTCLYYKETKNNITTKEQKRRTVYVFVLLFLGILFLLLHTIVDNLNSAAL